jgi:hypothetical protein
MPELGRHRILGLDLQQPVQLVLPVGYTGAGVNLFSAPTKWAHVYDAAGGVRWVNLIAADAHRAIRVYSYVIALLDVGGGGNAVLCFNHDDVNGRIMIHADPSVGAGLISAITHQITFAPIGVSRGINQSLDLHILQPAGGVVEILVQYSLEPDGGINDGE